MSPSSLRWILFALAALTFLLFLPGLLKADAAITHGPILVINSLGGSDTAASGSPADITAISATATCHTNGAASTTIQWAGNGFLAGGVPTGFKALLWLNTAAGRRWTEIDTYTANTVTVEDTFNIALASAVDCAVGGKRASLMFTGTGPPVASNQLCADVLGTHGGAAHGWQVNLENVGGSYSQDTTCTVSSTTQGCIFQGIAGSSNPPTTVNMTADATTMVPGNCDVKNLRFQNSNGAKTASIALQLNASNGILVQLNVIGGSGSSTGHKTGVQLINSQTVTLFANEIRFNTVGVSGAEFLNRTVWNWIHDNGTGFDLGACGGGIGGTVDALIFRNLIVANTGAGIAGSNAACGLSSVVIQENTIDGNGGDGVQLTTTSARKSLVNNQLTNNGGFGISCTAGSNGCESLQEKGPVAYNNFFGNTSGARSNWPVGESELGVDPQYVNRAGLNWCLNNLTNQGGPPGLGEVFPGSTTASFLVPGVCQPDGGGGGGGCCQIK